MSDKLTAADAAKIHRALQMLDEMTEETGVDFGSGAWLELGGETIGPLDWVDGRHALRLGGH